MNYRASAQKKYAKKRIKRRIYKFFQRFRSAFFVFLFFLIGITGVFLVMRSVFFSEKYLIDTVRFTPESYGILATDEHIDEITDNLIGKNYYLSRYVYQQERKQDTIQNPAIQDILISMEDDSIMHASVQYTIPTVILQGSGIHLGVYADGLVTMANTYSFSGDTLFVALPNYYTSGTNRSGFFHRIPAETLVNEMLLLESFFYPNIEEITYLPGAARSIVRLIDGKKLHFSHEQNTSRTLQEQLATYTYVLSGTYAAAQGIEGVVGTGNFIEEMDFGSSNSRIFVSMN